MKNFYLSILLFVFCNVITAQSWVEKMQDPQGNYYEIKEDFEDYWKNHDITEKGKGYKVFKRWEQFVEPRVYPSGNLSLLGLTAKNYEAFLKDYQSKQVNHSRTIGNGGLIASATWTPIGPMGPISGNAGGQFLKSGRLNFITINPSNANDLWVGAPSGGLWHSSNGGTNWSTATDNLSVIGCTDLAIDPTNTLVMYLATGDGYAGDTRSIGVLKSTNAGVTWSSTGLSNTVNNNFVIRRLIIHPTNNQILIAATNTGIYRTTNAGVNWTQVNTSSTYDLEFKPTNPNVVYACGTSFRMSTNGGVSWTTISSGIPTTGINRMAVAVTPADTNYVYVLASSSTNSGFQGFYRSVVGGTLFTQVTTTVNLLGYSPTGNDTGGQGWYTLCLAVSPLNRDEVVTGGVNVWRTTNSGASWSIFGHWTGNTAPFTHADQHDIEYDANGTLYCANDGTVYRRTTNNWQEISGTMNISQIYRIGMSALTANKWITGHQDNGTSIWNGTTYNAALGGDGMDCFYDRTNDQNVFGEYQNGGMQRSTNGGLNWTGATSGLTGTAPWLTVWKQDPQSATTLYCGRQNLFKSTNLAASWGTLAPFTATDVVREFAIAPSNNQIIYVLKNSGIYKTTNGGASWANVTGSVPIGSGSPDYICIDPTDPNNAWVVLSGYSSGNKVFVTTNGGLGWTNFSANLPNIPANCIAYQPGSNDRVYVGMDVGIYYRDNSLSNWVLYNSSLPNVPISDIEISPASPTLIHAATYGRGVWVASVYTPGVPPVSSFSVNTNLLCPANSVTFSEQSTNTPTAWLWSVNPTVGVAISSPTLRTPNFVFSAPGIYTVTLVATNATGAGNSYTQAITIAAPPNLNIVNQSASVCIGNSVSFTASGASTYTWSNFGGNSATSTYTPASANVYTVFGKSGNCTASKTVSVFIYAQPTIVITGSDTTCAGVANIINATGASSYTWSNGQVGSVLNVNPMVSTVYTVAGLSSNACMGYNNFSLNVLPLPQINVSSLDTLICLGEESILMANGATSYTWLPNGLSGSIINFTPSATSQFTCIGVDTSGCENSSIFTVIVDLCMSQAQKFKMNETTFQVYPNPINNYLYISSSANSLKDLKVEIYELLGRRLDIQTFSFDSSLNTIELSTSKLAQGVFILKLTQDNKNAYYFKILKE